MGFARKLKRNKQPKTPTCCGQKMVFKHHENNYHSWVCTECGKSKGGVTLMTREEAINYAIKHPSSKITHTSFAKDEYIYVKNGNQFYDENDRLFEDWDYWDKAHNGLRLRTGVEWNDGWFIKE